MFWGGTVALCQGLSVCIFLFWIIFYCCVVSSVPSSLNSSRPVSESPQDKKRSTSPPLHTLHQPQPWGCFLPFSPCSSPLPCSMPSTSAPPSPSAPSSPPDSGLPSQTRSLNLSLLRTACPDMIFVTSSTSSASVKYFWIFECWSSSDDPLGGAGNPLSSIYFLIFVQLCKWSLYICKLS